MFVSAGRIFGHTRHEDEVTRLKLRRAETMLRRYCSKITKPTKHSINFIRYKSSSLDATRAELTPKELELLLQPDEEEISMFIHYAF